MSKIKVLIVEDELFIAQSMRLMLEKFDYEVIGLATDHAETEAILKKDLPDIVLLDLMLRHGDDGIELARSIKQKYGLPVIFITSLSDKATVERAKEIHPEGYLVKPFEKEDLYTSVEIALSNFLQAGAKKQAPEEGNYFFKEYLFIKKNYQFEKVGIHDIQWIKSDGNYLEIYCHKEKKYLIRSTFHEFFDNVSSDIFLQVHKSYVVNFDYIDSVRATEIVVNKTIIPIGKTYHDIIRKRLNIVF
jgi:two-component system, LytTR family, response regulator LytT